MQEFDYKISLPKIIELTGITNVAVYKRTVSHHNLEGLFHFIQIIIIIISVILNFGSINNGFVCTYIYCLLLFCFCFVFKHCNIFPSENKRVGQLSNKTLENRFSGTITLCVVFSPHLIKPHAHLSSENGSDKCNHTCFLF